jgi:hypothetical protein
MKTADITPGELYAYQAGEWDTPRPVMLIAHGPRYTRAMGSLSRSDWAVFERETRRSSFRKGGTPMISFSWEPDPPLLAMAKALTLAYFEEATDGVIETEHGKMTLGLLTAPAHVRGPWAEVLAERKRREQEREASRACAEERSREARAHADALEREFSELTGLEAQVLGHVSMSVGTFEDLVGILRGLMSQ